MLAVAEGQGVIGRSADQIHPQLHFWRHLKVAVGDEAPPWIGVDDDGVVEQPQFPPVKLDEPRPIGDEPVLVCDASTVALLVAEPKVESKVVEELEVLCTQPGIVLQAVRVSPFLPLCVNEIIFTLIPQVQGTETQIDPNCFHFKGKAIPPRTHSEWINYVHLYSRAFSTFDLGVYCAQRPI